MICLQCGYCCCNYCVVIVDDPDIGLTDSEDNLIVHEGRGPCKHLRGHKPGEFFCAIHEKDWYPETPCAKHGQIERTDSECRMGRYVIDKFNKKEKPNA